MLSPGGFLPEPEPRREDNQEDQESHTDPEPHREGGLEPRELVKGVCHPEGGRLVQSEPGTQDDPESYTDLESNELVSHDLRSR